MDQCKNCECRGDLGKCLSVDCGHHENWYAKEQQLRIDEMRMLIIDMQATLRTCFNTTESMLSMAEESRKRLSI